MYQNVYICTTLKQKAMIKDEQLKIRLTPTTKKQFKETLYKNGNFITGVVLMFVDAYIKNPKQTITALQRLAK